MSNLRDAASLLVLQKTRETVSVLMGTRHAGHKFIPNRLVFPCGCVDAEDYSAASATPLRQDVLEQLMKNASPELSMALGHAAARELEEETGLTLGKPPHFAGLHYLCRAETPPASPIRFNARFFVVDAGLVSGAITGSGELEAIGWYELESVLALDLQIATRGVLGQLQTWLALSETERLQRKLALFRERAWTVE